MGDEVQSNSSFKTSITNPSQAGKKSPKDILKMEKQAKSQISGIFLYIKTISLMSASSCRQCCSKMKLTMIR